MSSKTRRLHVGNLPNNVERDALVKKFRKYGHIRGVDIKHRKEACTDIILSTFCFVDIETDDVKLHQCLQQLNGLKWDSQNITVSLAKESFLQRLQREREAAQNSKRNDPQISSQDHYSKDVHEHDISHKQKFSLTSSSSHTKVEDTKPSTLKTSNFSALKHHNFLDSDLCNSRKLPSTSGGVKNFGSSSEERIYKQNPKNSKLSSGTDRSSKCVLKKLELFSDVWKDPSDPLEETETFPYDSSSESEESGESDDASDENLKEHKNILNVSSKGESLTVPPTNLAEERRIKSLAEKQKTFEQQKKAVQLALSDGKVPRMNKKVIFDDEDCDDDMQKDRDGGGIPASSLSRFGATSKRQVPEKSKGLTLFEESDDEASAENWGKDFNIKKQFEGKKGKQLLDLQSRFNNDDRFNLDDRFMEEDEDYLDSRKSSEDEEAADKQNNELAVEREEQLQILSDILGQPISASKVNRESSAKHMVRFDPSKPNHVKYEVPKEANDSEKLKKKRSFDIENIKKTIQRKESEPVPVTKETFFEVSQSLTKCFKSTDDAPSSGFSLLQMFGTSTSETEKHEYPKNSNHSQEEVVSKPLKFKRNFEDHSFGGDEGVTDSCKKVHKNQYSVQKSNNRNFNQSITQQGSFFFEPDDSRLKEGDDFFAKIEDERDFRRKRWELKRLVNRKINVKTHKASGFKTKLGGRPRPRALKPRVGRSRGRR